MAPEPATSSAQIPAWVYKGLTFVGAKMNALASRRRAHINLMGDRDIEWSWVVAHLPQGPGEALDFGNGGASLGLVAAMEGHKVTAVDLLPVAFPYRHPGLSLLQGDVLGLPFEEARFDLVINCSTVEHVGLAGRYGVTVDAGDGDLLAMARLRSLMKPGAIMLLTVPVGIDAVFAPMCRVYGEQRLPRLLDGFEVDVDEFWVKDFDNRWITTDRAKALSCEGYAGSTNPLENFYGLGCFRLLRPVYDEGPAK